MEQLINSATQPVQVICRDFLTGRERLPVADSRFSLSRCERWQIACCFARYVELSEEDTRALAAQLYDASRSEYGVGEIRLALNNAREQVGSGAYSPELFTAALLDDDRSAVSQDIRAETGLEEVTLRIAGFYLVTKGNIGIRSGQMVAQLEYFTNLGRVLSEQLGRHIE